MNIVPSGNDTLPETLWKFFFLYVKNNLIFILGVFSALSKQTYIAAVAKIMTQFFLIQVKFSAVYPAFMHVLRLSDF